MIHSAICMALSSDPKDLLGQPITIALAVAALALLAMLVIWLHRLPSWLRARKSPALDPIQMEELMLGTPPQIVDLRESPEFKGEKGHIRGATNIPFRELPARVHELDTSHPRPIILVDETDLLSHKALPILKAQGHQWIYVLKGGFRAWRLRKLPVYRVGQTHPQP